MSLSEKNIIAPPASGILRCEYLVIGSGAGGSLSADYLSRKGKDVLIVEEGPFAKLENDDCRVANAFPKIWRNGGAIPVVGNTKFLFAEGRCVGGSTMINASLISTLPEEIIEEWKNEYMIDAFEPNMIAEYQNRIKTALDVRVLDDTGNQVSRLFKEGAFRSGYKGFDVPCSARFENGTLVKNNMQETFLKSAAKRGVRILPNCRIEKILLKNKKAYGVSARYQSPSGTVQKITIQCDAIFVCAGAIQSPLLLRRSGLKHNIGDSILFHPTLRVVAEFNEELNAYAYPMPSFQIKEFAPEISMGASISMPDFIAGGLALNWDANRECIKNFKKMAIFYVAVRGSSKGSVRNLPFRGSSYLVRYSVGESDLKNVSFGYAKLCKVLFSAGAKKIYPALRGVPSIAKESDAARYANELLPLSMLNLISLHSFSSCPMGEDRTQCAVDSFGKVYGMENIYVNDASMLPNAPGVNPQGPLMAIALRNLEKNFGI